MTVEEGKRAMKVPEKQEEPRVAAIYQLVTTGHLNMEERRVFETLPPREAELHAMISVLLEQDGCFPPGAKTWKKGEAVREGYFIERLDGGKFRLHWQRHHPLDPTQLVESFHRDYSKPWNAVRAFIRKEYGSKIDGIPIRYPNRILEFAVDYLPWILLALLAGIWLA